jgi:hypothetical protein
LDGARLPEEAYFVYPEEEEEASRVSVEEEAPNMIPN